MPTSVVLLPGILMPASLRYQPLIDALGPDVDTHTKELEVYSGDETPPPGYRLETELDGIDRFADERGLDRFHLYAHSGGAGCALAYVARDGRRVISLGLDEPATDWSAEMDVLMREVFEPMLDLDDDAFNAAFVTAMMRPGVAPPARPDGPPPPWMANRPAGVRAMVRAFAEATVDPEGLRTFTGPVYYSWGSDSNPYWGEMALRLGKLFGDYTPEEYEGASHMVTSHMMDPARVATRLRAMWARAGA